MKALVTGGSGYLGSVLIRKLLDLGVQVTNFDLNPGDDFSDVKFVQGDIRDIEAISSAVDGADWVFHNVAQVPLAKSKHLFQSVNRDGTKNLPEACLKHQAKKVIYTSSSAVFGVPHSNPVTELTSPEPMETYGKAKYEGELFCHEYVKKGLDVTIIRPRTIMGHGRLGIFQILFEWIRQGYNVPVLDGGHNRYQFVHADDFVDASILAAQKPGPQVYNCGAENFGTMRQVLEHLCIHAGTGSLVRNIPMAPAVWGMKLTSVLGLSPLGPYHSLMYGRSMWFDISKAVNELGWKPKYSNNEMFEQSYNWYVENRKKLSGQVQASHHRMAVRQGILGLVRRMI